MYRAPMSGSWQTAAAAWTRNCPELRILRVFPFAFAAYVFNWAALVRVVLVVAVVGSAIAIAVELARLIGRGIRAAAGGHPRAA